MSRVLRCPVEAGSIPYSAVSQPRPWPCIQRGTDSSTEAVQITRVPPQLISAEPVAVSTNPGSIVVGRSSEAARPPLRSRLTGATPPARAGARQRLDVAERELQEARAERVEDLASPVHRNE